MRLIKFKYLGRFRAMTIAPIGVFIKPKYINDQVTLKHEQIHWEQQRKCWYIGFYIIYLYEWITKGYKNISFEKEAYENESN